MIIHKWKDQRLERLDVKHDYHVIPRAAETEWTYDVEF